MTTVSELRERAQLEDLSERKLARIVILGNMPYGRYKGMRIIEATVRHPDYCEGLADRLKSDCYSSKTLKQIIINLLRSGCSKGG